MKIKALFIHPVADSQFCHLIPYLLKDGCYEISTLSSVESLDPNKIPLGPTGKSSENIQRYYFDDRSQQPQTKNLLIHQFEEQTRQGYAVYLACKKIKDSGYQPDIIICYSRHGAALFIKECFPKTPLLVYSEFFNSPDSVKTCLEPGENISDVNEICLRSYTATQLISLNISDKIVTPTKFQKLSHPKNFHSKIQVIHDGIDTTLAAPGKTGIMNWNGKKINKNEDEVITYISRNFESYRGFGSFIKAAEIIARQRPKAKILVAGGTNSGGYGGKSGEKYFNEVMASANFPEDRIFFLGPLQHQHLIKLLQLSHTHIYLTVPYILSWSMLEAMAVGVPVIASKTTPVQEFITHKKNGLLADLYNPEEIADNVGYLLDNSKLATALSQSARNAVIEKISIAVIGEKYKSLIRSMI